jgi:hypothetical protein
MCIHSCWKVICSKHTPQPHISKKLEQAQHLHAKIAITHMFLFFLSCCLIGRQFCAIGRQLWEELEDKFVQLELELLVVSSCVIPRQICPIGIGIVSCVFLCNTKTNLSNWNC